MSTPVYLQIGDDGQRIEIGNLRFADILRAVAESGSVPPEAKPRWFTDDGGQEWHGPLRECEDPSAPPAPLWYLDVSRDFWRTNDDGTLTWMTGPDSVGSPGDVELDHVSEEDVHRWFGPLTECEAPRAGDH